MSKTDSSFSQEIKDEHDKTVYLIRENLKGGSKKWCYYHFQKWYNFAKRTNP